MQHMNFIHISRFQNFEGVTRKTDLSEYDIKDIIEHGLRQFQHFMNMFPMKLT